MHVNLLTKLIVVLICIDCSSKYLNSCAGLFKLAFEQGN